MNSLIAAEIYERGDMHYASKRPIRKWLKEWVHAAWPGWGVPWFNWKGDKKTVAECRANEPKFQTTKTASLPFLQRNCWNPTSDSAIPFRTKTKNNARCRSFFITKVRFTSHPFRQLRSIQSQQHLPRKKGFGFNSESESVSEETPPIFLSLFGPSVYQFHCNSCCCFFTFG